MKQAFALMAVAGLALVSPNLTHADTVTTTDNLDYFNAGNTQSVSLLSFDASLTAEGLNPANYTLTGVTLQFNETSNAVVQVLNFGTSASDFEGAAQSSNYAVTLSINGSVVSTANSGPINNGQLVLNPPPAGLTITRNGATGTAPVGLSTYGISSPDVSVSATSNLDNVNPVHLSSWITSTPTLTLDANGTFDSGGTLTTPGAVGAIGGTAATTAAITATYTYQAVPEPSTWALMLGGLGMLVFLVRRKSSFRVK